MRLFCLMLLGLMLVGCGGGSGEPIPPVNPSPPPDPGLLEGSSIDGGEQSAGNTKKAIGETPEN